MATLKGMKFESPRGPIQIDPQTRDIIENIYIRRVDKVGDRYQNTRSPRSRTLKIHWRNNRQ